MSSHHNSKSQVVRSDNFGKASHLCIDQTGSFVFFRDQSAESTEFGELSQDLFGYVQKLVISEEERSREKHNRVLTC